MYKILLVEDEPHLLELYQEELQDEGYEVMTTMDGEEAVLLTKKNLPDLVVLDIKIRKLHGLEVLKKIKETDMEIAGYAAKLMPERLMEVCVEKNLSICGYGPIATMLWAAKKLGATKGEVLDYGTSFDSSRDSGAIVGYCSIVLH
jgi:CheY-like chemotaxis protein